MTRPLPLQVFTEQGTALCEVQGCGDVWYEPVKSKARRAGVQEKRHTGSVAARSRSRADFTLSLM